MTIRPASAPPGPRCLSPEQEIRFCRAPDGMRLAYAIHGSGPPLVVASCWLSHLQYDWQSPVWRHFLEDLGALTTVLRYDERGFGMSDWDVDDFSLAGPARRPRDRRRRGRARAVRAARDVRRLGRRDGLRDRPPGAGHAADPVRDGLRRAGRLRRPRGGRGGDVSEHDPGRLGEGGPGLPARLHDALHPRRDRGADALVRRPPADVDVARERGREPDRAPAGRHRRRPRADHRADADPPGDRRPVDDVRQRVQVSARIPGARLVPLDSRNHILLADEPAWADVHRRGRGVPRAGSPALGPAQPSGRSTRSRRASSTSSRLAADGRTNEEIADGADAQPRGPSSGTCPTST